MNLFQLASNDQSVRYLTFIFGDVGGVLKSGVTQITLMGYMFKTFNTIVLTIATMVVVYVTVVGVMKTAAEGEFLGKQWNKLWVPLRMVIGIAALVPIPSGYSSIQVVVMWIILQGIGAADTLWNSVIAYINTMGSPYASVSIPTSGLENNLKVLFQNLTCEQTAHRKDPNPYGSPAASGYYCNNSSYISSAFCNSTFDPMPTSCPAGTVAGSTSCTPVATKFSAPCDASSGPTCTFSMGPSSTASCGTLVYCNPLDTTKNCKNADDLECLVCKAQVSSLNDTVRDFRAIAQIFEQSDFDYRSLIKQYRSTPPDTSKPIPDWVQAYCSKKGIATDACCPMNGLPAEKTPCRIAGDLGRDSASETSMPDAWVSELIYPYALKQTIEVKDQGKTKEVKADNFITLYTNEYTSKVTQAVMAKIDRTAQRQSSATDNNATGWLFAGAYYYWFAQKNDANQDIANSTFTVNMAPGLIGGGDTKINELVAYRNDFNAAGFILDQVTSKAQASTTGGSGLPGSMNKFTGPIGRMCDSIMNKFKNMIAGGANSDGINTQSLIQIQSLGKYILTTIHDTFMLFLLLSSIIALVASINFIFFGTGPTNSIPGAMTKFGQIVLLPIIMVAIGTFLVIGATLAVYTPLIPFIVYTMGALGWFVLVIEAMIAAPLVALGILSPGAQHDLLGKAEPAVMLLFGIFLRPGLMIFGMMGGMLLSAVGVTIVNASYSMVMQSMGGNANILETYFFIISYVMLIIAVLNKAFTLIHVIPDQTIRWIGGHGERGETGEGALGSVKGGMGEGAKQAGSAMGAAGKSGGKVAEGLQELKDRKDEKKTEDKKDSKPKGGTTLT